MNNISILCVVVEESEDYLELINNLSGNYISSDITVDEKGEELEEPIIHPHKDLSAPDFSGNITFAHFVDNYEEYAGVDHIKIDTISTSKAWNVGFAAAKAKGSSHLVILNGAKNINPHIITLALEENSDKDIINLSDGGAFIVKCSSDFSANEEYKFWYADNEIFEKAVKNNSYGGYNSSFAEFEQAKIVSLNNEFDAAIEADIQKNK
jgi:hypothetical protein